MLGGDIRNRGLLALKGKCSRVNLLAYRAVRGELWVANAGVEYLPEQIGFEELLIG